MRGCHYRIKEWPLCSATAPGLKNVAHPSLRDKSKIYLLPLHIKFGLQKVTVKTVDN
jgi:hypothetical protein